MVLSLCVVLCVVWVIKLLPTHTVLEHLTMLEIELPCRLSQRLMPLKMTGGNSSEGILVRPQRTLQVTFSTCSSLWPL